MTHPLRWEFTTNDVLRGRVHIKEGCESVICTRFYPDKTGRCYGWHCARCDEPCSYQGHTCAEPPSGEDTE